MPTDTNKPHYDNAVNMDSLPTKKVGFLNKYLPDNKLMSLILALVFIGCITFIALNYIPRAVAEHKSLQLAGVKIHNQDKIGASQALAKAETAQQINIVIKDKTYTYSASDLGIKRDTSDLVDVAYAQPNSLINKFTAKGQEPSLVTYVQKKRLLAAIDSKLGDSKTIQNASVSVNSGSLTVNPGRPGLNIDYDQIINQLKHTDLRSKIIITAKFTQQDPQIPTSAAQAAVTEAEAMVAPTYAVKADSGATKTASAAQKNSWLVFTPDESTHKISVAVNVLAARSTMSSLAQSFNQNAKPQITLTATDGSTSVIDGGQPGLSVDGTTVSNGLSQFSEAIVAKQSYTMPITLAVTQQGQRNLGTSTGGKFVLVDVANYRAYAINNTAVDRTMVVSTGRPGLETPKGHFNILSKTRLITMRGCNNIAGCWVVPNVPNAEFFTANGDALHGTYWYVNWGHQNLSHGCVNLQLADAAWLYDWTVVGTDVIVV